MIVLSLALAAGALPLRAPEALLARRVAEVALAQIAAPDPRWEASQRDCAGLVRFAYRSAYRLLAPERLSRPLFADDAGRPSDFAEGRALLVRSFVPLGRGEAALRELRTGDLVAFRQPGIAGENDYHLMIAVVPPGAAPRSALVVYHPGSTGAAVRRGSLSALQREAPLEWRPVESNSAFLGFYRFKEWMR